MPTNIAKHGFTPPDPRILDPSTLEQIFAGQLTTRDSPFAGAMLGIEQLDRKQQAREYLDRLGTTNAMQRELALRQLEAHQQIEMDKTAANLYQQGAALANLRPLSPYLLDRGVAALDDNIRREGWLAKAMHDTGIGLERASQAGVQVNPGQGTNMRAGSLANLIATTGVRPDIMIEGLRAEPKTIVTAPSVFGPGGPVQITSEGRVNPADVVAHNAAARFAHGGMNVPTATNTQQQAIAVITGIAAYHGAQIKRQLPQGNNIVVEFNKPVLANDGSKYRQVVVGANGKIISTQ